MAGQELGFVSPLTEGAPYPLLVLSASGEVLYRNRAAVELRERIRRTRGDAVIDGITRELSSYVRTGSQFPAKRLVTSEHEGQHVAGELVFDRLGDDFVATWSDVTEREDGRRFLASLSAELTTDAHSLAELGSSLDAEVHELSVRADSVAASITEMSASINGVRLPYSDRDQAAAGMTPPA